jgi:hypothetical protein
MVSSIFQFETYVDSIPLNPSRIITFSIYSKKSSLRAALVFTKLLELMKKLTILATWLAFVCFTTAQAQNDSRAPEFDITKADMEAHLRFLASDALQGRRTGEMGNDNAAAYIASQYATYGLKQVEGAQGYYQPVPFEAITPPSMAKIVVEDETYTQGDNLLMMTGNLELTKTKAVFANYGWVDEETGANDYDKLDVKGKLVFVLPGTPEGQDPLTVFNSMSKKRKLAKEKGAVGLIELYRLQFPWQFFLSYFGKESLNLADKMETIKSSPNFVYGWIKEENKETFNAMKDSKKTKVELSSEGFSRRAVTSNNVIGLLEGTDPELKDEYLLITAHFDHVGTGKNGGSPYTPEDSIFNGARDNAMGTTALLGALQALAEAPPKRSVIFLAVTGEEIGLLGSQYYAENPLIPMEQVIFNLNTDGAGYNDPSYVSIVGFGRTGTDGLVEAASNIFGLDVFPNPAPEQNLFDRSDNVSFAKLGVPALCFSPGLTEFDEEISTYYHQAADNPDSIDFDYLQKFCQALARTARLIADDEDRPFWVEGDKYEEAGKQLYER